MTTTLSPTTHRRRRGFTLLEVMIAFAVLGLGLIMVAAIFPAALIEHSRTVDRSNALDLATSAETMLHNRIDPKRLYQDAADLAAGYDSPWNAIPFHNMTANNPNTWVSPLDPDIKSDWDNAVYPPTPAGKPFPTEIYYAGLNTTLPFVNPVQLFGLDYLSDTVLPRTDEIANTASNRLVWHGFYRTMASGTRQFAVAVCKQRQNKEYARQAVAFPNPEIRNFTDPRILNADLLDAVNGSVVPGPNNGRTRFPVPWRVAVGRLPNSQILTIPGLTIPNIGTALGKIAPRGSKLLIHGRARWLNGNEGVLDFPGGRILTVVDTDGLNRVQVLEDISDIQAYDAGGDGFSFDVWLFPPPIVGKSSFENESPIIEWKVSL
ncbi:MAG: prepilin-type N-terminal cleavage/methylation domain-containing protein [Phycisphaerales bacterium]|nr:prepilin-type N-terminal cleavage/methylation domain-containing protein [Phycisphaerales bacterium]